MAVKISKESAGYGPGKGLERCVTCNMFRWFGQCTLVEGRIKALDRCKFWDGGIPIERHPATP